MRDGEITGIFQSSGRGFGFVTPEGGGEDFFVPPCRDGGAWDGDTVVLQPSWDETEDGRRRVGAVVSVLKRVNRVVTGTLRKQGRELWLLPDRSKLPGPVRVPGKSAGARNGEKAAVTITSFGGRDEPPMGRLDKTFGRAGGREAAVEAALYQYGICRSFPPQVEQAASQAPAQVRPEDLAGRLDLREETIITIDGAEAKDLDDAVSLERDAQGRWVLGVHIADVSHYVAAGSALDLEAWERGTSVYFADQVIPMLPPALSNGICSLNPRVDRLTLSCRMTLTADGEIVDHKLAKSVIRTAERMTYADCNSLLEGGDPALEERYAAILPMLREMGRLAAALEKRRRLRGSLDLESQEAAILCDGAGRPVGVELRRPGRAEGLIESFMLAANETVARHLRTLDKPAVYRIHEKPSADKAERLRAMLAPFGLSLREPDHHSLQKVLEQVKGRPEAPAVNTILLRSLMKARYDAENLGHFGLAAEDYCHFTSPIRRYPDLMVHRILTALLDGSLHGAAEKKLARAAQQAARQSSERELAAQSAEREIEKFYMAEFMQGHLGERFSGLVSGVTRFGLFILLANGVEGLLPATALPEDGYSYDEGQMTLTGERTGVVFSFGMALEAVCVSADPGSGQIEFCLPGGERPASAPPEHPGRPGAPKERRKGGFRPPKRQRGRKRR